MVPRRRPPCLQYSAAHRRRLSFRCTSSLARAGGAQSRRGGVHTYAPLRRSRSATDFTHARNPLARCRRADLRRPRPRSRRRPRRADADRAPDAAADEATSRKHRAGETHTYEADQDGDLNLQLTMVSFADAKAKKGETYVVYAAADDGTEARVYETPWRNG